MAQVWTDQHRTGHRSGNGDGPEPEGLPLVPTGARRRLPEAVIGALLVLGAILAFVVWQATTSNQQAVLALASDVARGQIIEQADLRTAHLEAEEGLGLLPAEVSGQLVGRRAVADLGAGTLLTEGLLADQPPLEAGQALVGVAVEAAAIPSPDLAPGDAVQVIHTIDTGGRVLTEAVVADTEEAGPQGLRVVSLKVPLEAAGEVAAASASGRVRLVQVPTTREAS